jgi:hypothetical protein
MNADFLRELRLMGGLKRKMEIEALYRIGGTSIFTQYLITKVLRGDYI